MVERSLNRTEISRAIIVHIKGVGNRRSRFDGERPSVFLPYASESFDRKDALINSHIITMPIVKHIVVEIDVGSVSTHHHWMEVEAISKTADDVQLVIVGGVLCLGMTGCSWTHGAVGRYCSSGILVRKMCVVAIVAVCTRRSQASGFTDVE